jgi:hypothetical protein
MQFGNILPPEVVAFKLRICYGKTDIKKFDKSNKREHVSLRLWLRMDTKSKFYSVNFPAVERLFQIHQSDPFKV